MEKIEAFSAQPGPNYNNCEFAYINACKRVLRSQILSGYRGNSSVAFFGGSEILNFETKMIDKYNLEYGFAINSCTSALYAACVALNLQPGDEVIVSPWSMSCSATIPLQFGAIPVFADIEKEYFCLDVEDVAKKITSSTKAIIAVDLFGQPISQALIDLANKKGIPIIEDAAQAIGSKLNGSYAGTLGAIGTFSFTQGKHMTAGEGGFLSTSIYEYWIRARMFSNHGEAVCSDANFKTDFSIHADIAGLNLRMTEMQAAILSVEFDRIDTYIENRIKNVERLKGAFSPLFELAPTREGATHTYYVMPMIKSHDADFHVCDFVDSLKKKLVPDKIRIDRGVPVNAGYIKPLYKMPLFQQKKHWAFWYDNAPDYSKLCLTNAEVMNSQLLITLYHGLDLQENELEFLETQIKNTVKEFV